jgi:hypothetical protein
MTPAPAPRIDESERRHSRRRFGFYILVLATAFLIAGVIMSQHSGDLGSLGQFCLADGIGLAVAGAYLVLGRNPLDRDR